MGTSSGIPTIILWDWEYSHCSYYHYAMQQSGYRYILKKNYGIEIEACWLAVFHPTLLNYKLIRLPYLEEEVKAVLAERAARFR